MAGVRFPPPPPSGVSSARRSGPLACQGPAEPRRPAETSGRFHPLMEMATGFRCRGKRVHTEWTGHHIIGAKRRSCPAIDQRAKNSPPIRFGSPLTRLAGRCRPQMGEQNEERCPQSARDVKSFFFFFFFLVNEIKWARNAGPNMKEPEWYKKKN